MTIVSLMHNGLSSFDREVWGFAASANVTRSRG
ncbi:hypothetical protein HJB79_04620 [Rhizobium lentis]|nr:hypothetical protein [Rhizobium lentis]MBX5138091.1 hypothetical protein [Rhizobium lentis]